MKRLLRRLCKRAADERGSAALWFLFTVPMMVLILVFSWEATELQQTTNWLKESLNRATKAAAFQITLPSYAVGMPVIDPAEADAAFREYLARNLRLDPLTLEPLEGNARLKSAPNYTLYVYNGPFPYRYVNAEYGIDITLNNPTAIGLLKVKFGGTVLPQDITIRRWATAEVHERTSSL